MPMKWNSKKIIKMEKQKGKKREEKKEEGREEGILLEKKNLTLQLFKSKFPNEDDNFLSNLEVKEYDIIFKMLLENQSLEKIKDAIKR